MGFKFAGLVQITQRFGDSRFGELRDDDHVGLSDHTKLPL